MLKIPDIGQFAKVPSAVQAIVDENLARLGRLRGLDVNAPIALDEDISETPLHLAIVLARGRVVEWLLARGVDLNAKGSPSILSAARYGDAKLLRKLAAAGANVHAVNSVGSDAFEAALAGKRHANLPVLEALGHTAEKYGGGAFRSAVFDGDRAAVEFFLAHGVDVNHQKADQVFPNRESPLCVATRNGDLRMVKRLVEAGADLSIRERGGQRPYDIALEENHDALREYIRSVEPASLHSQAARRRALAPFALPPSAVALMKRGAHRLPLPGSPFRFLELYPLLDAVPLTFGRKKLLRISRATGDYTDIVFVWDPKTKKVAALDQEHEELTQLASFDDFLREPGRYLDKLF
ncbi:MAG: ankyrin repeat domain-containing protein [Polyangiaceae bacterium]